MVLGITTRGRRKTSTAKIGGKMVVGVIQIDRQKNNQM